RVEGTGGARRGFWAALAEAVMAHPWRVLIPVVALLLALGLPFLRVEFGAPDASVLPPDVESRRGVDLLQARVGAGELTPTLVVLQAEPSPLAAERIPALVAYVRRIQADPRVARVASAVSLDPRIPPPQY